MRNWDLRVQAHFPSSPFAVAPGHMGDVHLMTAVHTFNLIA